MSGSWLGDSSYRNDFQNPKNHVSASKKPKQPETPRKRLKDDDDASSSKLNNPSSHFSSFITIKKLHTGLITKEKVPNVLLKFCSKLQISL